MRVLHINNSDIKGGASRAAHGICLAERSLGIDAGMFVQLKHGNEAFVKSASATPAGFAAFAFRKLLDEYSIRGFTIPERGRFSYDLAGLCIRNNRLLRQTDVIHLHWVQEGFFSLDTFNALARMGKPIVWTLHDMWPLTGGCHYSSGCLNYMTHCGRCPSVKGYSFGDRVFRQFEKKLKIFKELNLNLVTCSSWLKERVLESSILKDKPVMVIPNPIDTGVYRPSEKVARVPDQKTLIFGTMTISERRKGFHLLKAALRLLKERHPELNSRIKILVFGGAGNLDSRDLPYPAEFAGRISGDENIAAIYNRGDIFLAPSIEDNLPNTVMEALSCGIPVVAFNRGGVPDMVSGRVGCLAEETSPESFMNAVYFMLTRSESELNEYSLQARQKVLSSYRPEDIAAKYISLYRSLL